MKVRFGKKQLDCINHRLVHLCESEGMNIFLESYNEDDKYDENDNPIFTDRPEYTTDVLNKIHDNMDEAEQLLYNVFCKGIETDEYSNCIKGATLDVSLFNTDGLRHAGYWILQECVGDGSTWYDIARDNYYEDSCPFKTENEVSNFEYRLQDKVDNIDWGFEK
jgi:hypothetical protein